MRFQHRVSWIAAAVVALALGATACGGTSPDSHPGTGIVKEVDAAARTITLDHEEIPGLMKGMTMTFNVAPDVRLEEIPLGAEVHFRVKEEGGIYTVTEVQRQGS